MKKSRKTISMMLKGISLFMVAAAATAADGQAAANTDTKAADKTQTVEEVVVTGTLIRGIAPAGSIVVSVSRDAIDLSGVTNSNALLGQLVPQSNFFLANPTPGENNPLGISRVPLNRPNLRDLPNTNTGSGQPTLVLMDGHRIVPAGIDFGLVVDVGVIPMGAIERVETILDGASAIYGSDAVGGVINYITRKRFDQTRASGTYGMANGGYWSSTADVTTGKTWDGGGIGFTYSFSKNSFLRNSERDYTAPRNALEGGHLTGLGCDTYGHVQVGTSATLRTFVTPLTSPATERTVGSPGSAGTVDYCASNAHSSLFPALDQHAGQVVISQDLSDSVKLDVSGFYGHRLTTQDLGPFVSTVAGITPTSNPYYTAIAATPAVAPTASQTAYINYGPVLGFENFQLAKTTYEIGQIDPAVTWDLGKWQLRVFGAYGWSTIAVDQLALNTTLQGSYFTGNAGRTGTPAQLQAAAINPYNVAASTNRALFGDLAYHNLRDGKTTFVEASAVADGTLFSIPGGDVKSAVGVEWSKTKLTRRTTNLATRILGPYESATASNKSIFAELSVPFFGPQNRLPALDALTLQISGRYDTFDDYGNTFNPKVGISYDPVSWLTLRGTWGKSFRAPNALDKLGSNGNGIGCVGSNSGATIAGCTNVAVQLPPGYTAPAGSNVYLVLTGTSDGVRPEHSKNWSAGFEVRPIEGLTLSASYFLIDFTDYLSGPSQGNLLPIFANAPQLVLFCINPNGTPRNVGTGNGTGCTNAEIASFVAKAPNNNQAALQTATAAGANVLYFVDTSVTNLGGTKIAGVDLSTRYSHPTNFGSIDASVNATRKLKNDFTLFAGGPVSDLVAYDVPRLRLTAQVGATIGDFRAQVLLQHQNSYPVTPSATQCTCQTSIDSFDVVNTSFRYNVNGSSPMAQNLALTLTVNNVLDAEPPKVLSTTGAAVGTAPAATLGRFFQFGINKEF